MNDDELLAAGKFVPSSYEGKPANLPKAARKILSSFSRPMFERVDKMSADELRALITACRQVSQTNCGWDQYAMAKLLHDSAFFHLATKLAEDPTP